MYITRKEDNQTNVLLPPFNLIINNRTDLNKIYAIFNNSQILDALDISKEEASKIRKEMADNINPEIISQHHNNLIETFRNVCQY